MRHNVAIAARNLSTNGEARVTLLHAAASDRAGVVRMASRLNAQVALNSRGDVVTAVTVDELAAAHGAPDVLFVDVEGYEIHVLSGATSVLRDIRPDLFIEVHSGVGLEQFGTAKDLLALIPPDYSIFVSPTSPASFVPLDADSKHLLAKHSLLIALASRRTLTQ
jgi:FkbM family methyltransferase